MKSGYVNQDTIENFFGNIRNYGFPCAKVGILPDLPTRPRIGIIMAAKTCCMVLPRY